MSTYIRYAKATKLMINNVVYIISTSSFYNTAAKLDTRILLK